MEKLRRMAAKLAGSSLPILVAGAVGTGRRTMAAALVALRAVQGRVVQASALDGLPKGLHAGDQLMLHHLEALDRRQQAELADSVRSGVSLTATATEGATLAPELGVLVDATKVSLPPLQDRGDDVVAWAEYFAERAARDAGRATIPFSPTARLALATRTWPGNLSELEAVVRRAVLLGADPLIAPEDLGVGEKFVVQSLNDAVEAFRMNYVAKVLDHFGGNRTQAARALGVDPRTMFRYLAKARGAGNE
jgi:DNA-binding NtrC family response regulator